MTQYHPQKQISNNQATIYTADLSYEAHGKCGCQTIILTNLGEEPVTSWDAAAPNLQPGLPNSVVCSDVSNVYKIVALANTKFRSVAANNLATNNTNNLVFGVSGFILKTGSEMLADFTAMRIISGMLILYRDCNQS